MSRWQAAGCPTIPQPYKPWHGYFTGLAKQSAEREAEKAVRDERSKSQNKQGLLARAGNAVARFFQRRRA